MTLSYSGRHLFIVDSYVKINFIFLYLTTFRIDLQVYDMKVVTWILPQSSMHPENKVKYTNQNFIKFKKRKFTFTYEYTINKGLFPNYPNDTIQDSKQWLMQIVRNNHCIESQTGI